MTFIDPSDLPMLRMGRRFNPTSDISRTAFVDEDLALYDLMTHHARTNRAVIEGVTFTRCRIEGPAVMLVLDGTTFEATDFGETRGSMANMVLRPAGTKAIGAIPVRNCTFVGCEFAMLGFTGNDRILDQILAIGQEL
jgi:hypothetical protein